MSTTLYNENLPRDRYVSSEYNHGARWMSYSHQIRLLVDAKASSVLEIGPGHGWMARILHDMGIDIKTVDINPALQPDYVADVSHLPLPDGSFDVVCAFEVLEHMPFELFATNLAEMARVARTHVIISLPDQRRTLISATLKIPFVPAFSLFVKVPSFRSGTSSSRHYWEIGRRGYSPNRIKREAEKAGLRVEQAFVPQDTPMNYYMVMTKRRAP